MTKYLVRRTLSGLVALVLFTAGMFLLVEALIPGDYATPSRLSLSGPELEVLRTQLGLDRPILIRYLFWLRNVVTHGLGSTTLGWVGPGELMRAIPATALVFMVGIGVAYLFGSWLGRIAGWRRGARGRALTFLAVTTYTIFPPFLGFMLVYLLRSRLVDVRNGVLGSTVDWLGVDRAAVMGRMTVTIVIATLLVFTVGVVGARVLGRRRGLPLLGKLVLVVGVSVGWWAYRGMLGFAIDVLFLAAVPTIAFAVLSYGDFLLVMRTSIAAVRHEDYVMAATAKGLPDRVVRDHHAARNAVLPVLGRLVVSLPYLLSGLIIIEESVGWAGMGTLLFDAVSAQDMPVVMDILLLIGVLTLVVRLVFEIMQAVLDPRIWRAV